MRTAAGVQEPDHLHRVRIDDRHAVAALVGDVENASVGRNLDVNRQSANVDVTGELHVHDVDLGHDARVLGRDEQVAAIRAEVEVVGTRPRNRDLPDQLPGPWTAELDLHLPLDDVDRL